MGGASREFVELRNQPEEQLVARLHGLGNAGSHHPLTLPSRDQKSGVGDIGG